MNNSTEPSRRDWFRLRFPHQNKLLSAGDNPVESEVFQTIEQPPNHDGLDLSELPPMREAILSIEQVNSLFDDIQKLTTDVLLMQRSNGAQRANHATANADQLTMAKSALLAGKLQNLQIRYRWRDSLWIDTLATQPDGYRLVRIAHASHRNV